MRYKLTNAIEKEIKGLAEKLPKIPHFDIKDNKIIWPLRKVIIKGSELKERWPEFCEKYETLHKKQIEPLEKYTLQVADRQVYHNHNRLMKRVYQQQGWPGVEKYINELKKKRDALQLYKPEEDKI